jgi:protein-L-isoaspartate O-methyltransferase
MHVGSGSISAMKIPGRLACVVGALCASAVFAAELVRSGGPYVPTPQTVVDAMLDLARVGPADFVIDLGSGDGRIVLSSATRHKASGMGVDIDGELVDLANASARRLGVAERVRFLQQDVFATDISQATVLTLYLLPGMMESLRPKLLKELKPGTRIVSHDFDFGEWKPDRTIEVKTDEKYDLTGNWTSNVHLWTVPAAVEGAWNGSITGERGSFLLQVRQRYQHFEGEFTRDAQVLDLKGGRIDGSSVRFVATTPGGGSQTFTGTVNGMQMSGETQGGVRWSATRVLK